MVKAVYAALRFDRVGDARDGFQVFQRDAIDFDAGIAVGAVGHDLPAHNGRGAGDPIDLRQVLRQRVIVRNGPQHLVRASDWHLFIDRHMGVGPKDGVDKFSTEPRPHGQRCDQRKHRERYTDQRNPRHHAHPAFGPFGADIAPRDHPFEFGKGGGTGHGLSCD